MLLIFHSFYAVFVDIEYMCPKGLELSQVDEYVNITTPKILITVNCRNICMMLLI